MSKNKILQPKIRFKEFSGENAEAWEQRKASELFKSISDKNHPNLPVLSASQEKGMILRDDIGIDIKYDHKSLSNYKRVTPGQFVIHLRSFQGGFADSQMEGITSPAYTVIDFKEKDQSHSLFWKEILTSQSFIKRLETVTYGIRDGRSISFSDFSTLKFIVPKLDEQEKIAVLFKILNQTITLHQRKLEALENLKKTLLSKMFPKNGKAVPELRFAGFTDNWEQRKLGDFVIKAVDNRGKTPPTQEFGRYPLLEVASLGKASPDYTKVTKYVDEETYSGWFRAHIKKDDILFSTVGNTGLVTLMDDYVGATIAQNIVAFRAIEGNNPQFLVQMFQLSENLKRAKRIEMGAVQPSIKVSQLIHVSYLLPNSEQEQEKVGLFFKQVDTTITLHQRKIEQYQELKKTLLSKMFI